MFPFISPYKNNIVNDHLDKSVIVISRAYNDGFTPFNLPDIKLWIRGDSAVDDGAGRASLWRNYIDNSKSYIQDTVGQRPVIIQNALNDRVGVSGDGVDDLMTVNLGETLSQPNTVVTFLAKYGTKDNCTFYDGIISTARNQMDCTSGTLRFYAGSSSISYAKATPFDFTIFLVEYNGAASQLFENGVLKSSGNPGSHSLTGMTLFNRYAVTDNASDITVLEQIVVNGLISAQNKAKLYQYFNSYYNL